MLENIISYVYFLSSWYCWKYYIIPFMAGWYVIQISDIVFNYLSGFKSIMKKNLLFILGSGGHTGEMLKLFEDFDFSKYKCIYFVRSEADRNSEIRLRMLLEKKGTELENCFWITIPRSRNVKQSYFSSIFTSIWSILVTFFKLFKFRDAEALISNGPGVAIPVFAVFFVYRILLLSWGVKTVFIESFCRVKELSLTGKILYRYVNKQKFKRVFLNLQRFIVQWPELKRKYPKAQYMGTIV